MTPEEVAALEQIGNGMVMNLTIIAQIATFFGIYIVLAIAAIFCIWRRRYRATPCLPGRGSRASIFSNSNVLILLLVITFGLMTLQFSVWISATVGIVKDRFVRNLDLPFEDRLELASWKGAQASIPLNWAIGQGGLLVRRSFLCCAPAWGRPDLIDTCSQCSSSSVTA
jgi:hypothetical protein